MKKIKYLSDVLCIIVLCGMIGLTGCEKTEVNDNNIEQGSGDKPEDDNKEETEEPIEVLTQVLVVESSITATTASFSGTVSGLPEDVKTDIEVGMAYSSESDDFQANGNTRVPAKRVSDNGTFEISLSNIPYGTKYYYCSYSSQKGVYTYGEVKEFTTANIVPQVSVDESSITTTTAVLSGTVSGIAEADKSSIEVGLAYSSMGSNFKNNLNVKVPFDSFTEDGICTIELTGLSSDKKYYYCTYIKQNEACAYGQVQEFATASRVTLLWSDEFDGTETLPDQNIWKLCEYGPYAWAQYFVNDSWDNVKVEDGYLKLKGDKVDGNYRNGGIRTKEGFPVNTRVEVRAKMTKLVRGAFPAIWQTPIGGEGWPRSGEIDIMEWIQGSPNLIYQTIHRSPNNDGADASDGTTVACDATKWHVYSVDRTDSRLTFYLDGEETWSFVNRNYGIYDYPFSEFDFDIILNFSLGGYLNGSLTWPGYIYDQDLPGEMWVDWVKVYTL